MKFYLMNTNAGRSMVINEHNKWYFACAINGCDIGCDSMREAIIENLKKYVKTIYSNADVIDMTNFEYMTTYDGLDACSFLDAINSNEIRQGVTQEDLSAIYFIYDTDAIKRG